jgi:hypothetical protein
MRCGERTAAGLRVDLPAVVGDGEEPGSCRQQANEQDPRVVDVHRALDADLAIAVHGTQALGRRSRGTKRRGCEQGP